MRWRSGARPCCSGFNFRISGRAMLVLAFLLLAGDARWTAAALMAAAIHELGHLAALRLLGVRIYGMEVEAWGAVIRTEPLSPREELLCAAAGPCAGLLLCLLWSWLPRV